MMDDTVKPSRRARAVAAAMKAAGVNRSLESPRLERALARRDRSQRPIAPPDRLVRGLTAEASVLAGLPVWRIAPRQPDRTRPQVVCVHGGAYVGQIGRPHWWSYIRLVRQLGATVHVPIYPLAPEHTADTVVPAAAELIGQIVAQLPAGARLTVSGDSAGGGLALAAVQRMVQRELPRPHQLVLVSPWLDATVSDRRSLQIDDPALSLAGLRHCGRLWAGPLDPADPLVSPLFGQLDQLPPTTAFAGTRDILCPDSWRLQERAAELGAPVSLVVGPGMVHGWPIFPGVPESVRAHHQMLRLIAGRGD
jgi:acetyl esterase/lipase